MRMISWFINQCSFTITIPAYRWSIYLYWASSGEAFWFGSCGAGDGGWATLWQTTHLSHIAWRTEVRTEYAIWSLFSRFTPKSGACTAWAEAIRQLALLDYLTKESLFEEYLDSNAIKELPFKLIVATAWVANLYVDLFIRGHKKRLHLNGWSLSF